MDRRRLLAGAASAAFCLDHVEGLAAGKGKRMPPRIAAIVTEYRVNSHADVIVSKFLEGCETLDERFEPRVEIASLYMDQVPENDIGRDMAKKHGVPIFKTIAEALTLGGEKLAVDGALLIGEHGTYGVNEIGQYMYPRRRFFEETAKVIRAARRPIPLFNDKHLAYNWADAKWMYETARELKIPFMAGSSLPVTWRKPPIDVPLGSRVEEAVAIGYGGIEAYGFHALEAMQCMIERRVGGETGVKAVQALRGAAVWEAAREGRWSRSLLDAALQVSEEKKAGRPEDNVKEPVVFLVEHVDGLETAMVMLQGHVGDFTVAARLRGRQEPAATLFWLQDKPFGHFMRLSEAVQKMFLTGKPTYPVERTLLTTGILDAAMNSLHEGGKRRETPDLARIRYRLA